MLEVLIFILSYAGFLTIIPACVGAWHWNKSTKQERFFTYYAWGGFILSTTMRLSTYFLGNNLFVSSLYPLVSAPLLYLGLKPQNPNKFERIAYPGFLALIVISFPYIPLTEGPLTFNYITNSLCAAYIVFVCVSFVIRENREGRGTFKDPRFLIASGLSIFYSESFMTYFSFEYYENRQMYDELRIALRVNGVFLLLFYYIPYIIAYIRIAKRPKNYLAQTNTDNDRYRKIS